MWFRKLRFSYLTSRARFINKDVYVHTEPIIFQGQLDIM